MIHSLNGKLIYKDNKTAVVECGGVGYGCFISMQTAQKLPPLNESVFLFTYMQVREDAMELFGFITKEELEAFKLITSVNSVGPKLGIAILSEFDPDRLLLFIASGDSKALTAASGVGIKLASRIVLELKDKVKNIGNITEETINISNVNIPNSATKDAVEALVSFGFTNTEASAAVSKCDPSLAVDDIIKQALKYLSK